MAAPERGAVGSDWDPVVDEVVELLQQLVRFDTTNPPGNETPCLRWVQDRLAQDGIASELFEAAPGRGNLVARLRADGESHEDALLLTAHVDVVAADADDWTHDPFGAVVADGFVWGRGTLDMKGPAATWITLFRYLKRSGLRLRRDVVLMLNADEETGGSLGAAWMMAQHRELIGGAVALNEGGGMAITVGDRRYYAYAVDEKRSLSVRLRARGTSGHAAIPHDDNAIAHLSRALLAVGSARIPARITEVFAACISTIAKHQPEPLRSQLAEALDPERVDAVLDAHVPFPLRERLRAMVRTTFVPTIVRAGDRANVVPERAEAVVNCRALPEDGPEAVRRQIEALLGEAGVRDHVAVELPTVPEFPPSPARHPFVESLQRGMQQHAPGQPLIPTVGIAGSDSRHLRPGGIPAYGFYPMLPEVDPRLFHNVDERVSLEQLAFATRVIGTALVHYCGSDPRG